MTQTIEEIISSIGEAVSSEPSNIKEIKEEVGIERSTATRYLQALTKAGFLKTKKMGRQQVYWRPLSSDRQTGLELRGIGHELGKAHEHLEKAMQQNENLIEESVDPVSTNNKTVSEEGDTE